MNKILGYVEALLQMGVDKINIDSNKITIDLSKASYIGNKTLSRLVDMGFSFNEGMFVLDMSETPPKDRENLNI